MLHAAQVRRGKGAFLSGCSTLSENNLGGCWTQTENVDTEGCQVEGWYRVVTMKLYLLQAFDSAVLLCTAEICRDIPKDS